MNMTRYTEQIELIISPSSIIFDSIQANIKSSVAAKTILISGEDKEDLAYPKIDLLILDGNLPIGFSLWRVKNIINLVSQKIRGDEIVLAKPFKLGELISIISKSRARTPLFCDINGEWIYDEQLKLLLDGATSIKFTEKENEIFKHLLLAPKHQLSRTQLLTEIWNYHPDIDSTTIEMHFYRLKNKLPINILHYKDNYYRLSVSMHA